MASKTNVEGRKEAKQAAKIKHFDAKGHIVVRVMYAAKGKFVWHCSDCGVVERCRHE